MLGNQYYLARRFDHAMKEFVEALIKDPQNKQVKKKLMVCYIKNFRIQQAYNLFYELITSDINLFLTNDLEKDDYPCSEIIFELINYPNDLSMQELYTCLGMLYMCCDVEESLRYFSLLSTTKYDKKSIAGVIDILNNAVNNQKKGKATWKRKI